MPRVRKVGYVVIGAGYGDEGKGLLTDYLVSSLTVQNEPPVNVRFNGGAQAGHTVIRDGKRHVFGHVGAGTFAAASTFLSSRFIVNPFALHKELDQLRNMDVFPRIEVHPDSPVTTYFDIELNRQMEMKRGVARHGSCGLGINETVTRTLAGFPLTVDDLMQSFDARYGVRSWIESIWYNWWLPRADQYGIDLRMPHDLSEATLKREIKNLSSARNLFGNVSTRPDKNHSNKSCYVFEGAQGLELDEYLGTFPHVTRSVTGLLGAAFVAAEMGIQELHPIYVTRAYKTRHGAGELPHEGETFTHKKLVDKTNVSGPFQGDFRYAPLDISRLEQLIDEDLERSLSVQMASKLDIHDPVLAVTCLDQVTGKISFYDHDGCFVKGTQADLLDALRKIYPVKYVSHGPEAKHIRSTSVTPR